MTARETANPRQRVIESLKEAIAGNFAAVTIDGVRWVRGDVHKDALTAERETGRRAGLEEAAKVARKRAAKWRVHNDGACSLPLEEECEDIATAILAPVSSLAPEGDGWRTMDSAPKDGTRIILWAPYGVPYVGSWRHGSRNEPSYDDIAWRASCCGRMSHPTHWQPLPSPPTGNLSPPHPPQPQSHRHQRIGKRTER